MTLEAPPSPRPIPAYAGAIACICLVAACGVAMAGAFAYLDRSSLWLDELCTVFFQQGNVYDVFEKTIHFDVHPPLYMELLGRRRPEHRSPQTQELHVQRRMHVEMDGLFEDVVDVPLLEEDGAELVQPKT